jgi:hypothetical protein
MRWISRPLIVLIVCLVAVSLPISPTQAAEPVIGLSPDDGVPGVLLRVTGYNFTPESWVDVYYYLDGSRIRVAEIETDDDGDFRVDFEVPESYTGDHDVYAEDEDGLDASDVFTVQPGLTISPSEGPVGTNVTVTGHGFAQDEEGIELLYYVNGDNELVADGIQADEDGRWEASFPVPVSSRGNHKIDARGSESELQDVQDTGFEVAPVITIVDPVSGSPIEDPSGSPGEDITMAGSGFEGGERDITILFDGEETDTNPDIIRADDSGHWQATFEVPQGIKGTYSVTAEGEWTPREDVGALSFEMRPGLVLSPNHGHVATELTVTGGGFPANKAVVITYEDSHVGAAETGSTGSFEVGVVVPESQHGQRQVTAEDTGGNIATAFFTMESTPPDRPDPISPDDGDSAGFIGGVRPTLEWSAVSDDSGVRYNLQIARGNNVTAGGFADPVVSVTDIVGTNYTLGRTEALAYGTYYWIVQAVDGADNESGWTAARSFHAGRLPLWAFVLIIVAIVAGIGTAVYFFVIRRRVYYL